MKIIRIILSVFLGLIAAFMAIVTIAFFSMGEVGAGVFSLFVTAGPVIGLVFTLPKGSKENRSTTAQPTVEPLAGNLGAPAHNPDFSTLEQQTHGKTPHADSGVAEGAVPPVPGTTQPPQYPLHTKPEKQDPVHPLQREEHFGSTPVANGTELVPRTDLETTVVSRMGRVDPDDPSRVPDGWYMPTLDGRCLWEISEEVTELKKKGEHEKALDTALLALEVLEEACKTTPNCAMEHYVIQVAILQTKLGRNDELVETLDRWLGHSWPVQRDDYHYNLLKRRAKAMAKKQRQTGGDPGPFEEQWKVYRAKEREAEERMKSERRLGAVFIASGASQVGIQWEIRTYTKGIPGTRSSKRSVWRDTPTNAELNELEFVAVDFETANEDRRSACQIALVKFIGGAPHAQLVSYIKPPTECNEFTFTYIHGIKPRTVRQAPTWDALTEEIGKFVGDAPVYAHNAAFDHTVWQKLDEHYGTDTCPERFFCTVKLAQKLWPNLKNHKLPTVVKHVKPGYRLKHHEASSDAKACGWIVANAAKAS
ncbi:3'-5' exonuclease [Corynebacterium mendelii]|uniref:Exonuclease domain-containing protein n=1 Tax=Corynebacterium mendelii TaxID=2765362 RepID=A0A939IXA8_9CORY|nr:3'-5' exonuclease [Corynebacterium mendelii]MBN9644270.1 hypothetical protein [Corynebacterium mendelii]